MQIKISRAQLDAKRAELKALGVDLTGDTGTVEHSGVKLSYSYNGDTLDIETVHKPFYVPASMVESQVTAWFAGA